MWAKRLIGDTERTSRHGSRLGDIIHQVRWHPSKSVLRITAVVSVALIVSATIIFLSRQTLPKATQFAGLGSFIIGILSLSVPSAPLVTARLKAAAANQAQAAPVGPAAGPPRSAVAAAPSAPAVGRVPPAP